MINRTFDRKNIIITRVQEDDINSFLIDLDIDDNGKPLYQLDEFTRAVINTIPEYVFAEYENPKIPQTDAVEKLREAARSIYKPKSRIISTQNVRTLEPPVCQEIIGPAQ